MQFIIDNGSKIVPLVLLLMAVLLFSFAFVGGAFGLHFDEGQLTTLTNILYGLSGLGLGTAGGALLATREMKASIKREGGIVATVTEAAAQLQKVLDNLALAKANRHGADETAENQPGAWFQARKV